MLRSKRLIIYFALLYTLLSILLNPILRGQAEALSTHDQVRAANEDEIKAALRLFADKDLSAFFSYLDSVRPKARRATAKRRQELLRQTIALATASGQITRAQIQEFQERFASILKLHHRENAQALVLFWSDQPSVTNLDGTLIIISSKSVELAESEAGLVGLIAHEVAHDYLSSSHIIAQLDTDSRCGREIELVCDGIAVATLLRLGLDPAAYAAALERNILSSPEIHRLNQGDLSYPSLETRLKMIRLVSDQFSAMAEAC